MTVEAWFSHVLEGRFSEKEQEFIRQCFRKGEKKMISGFEQIVIEERENAKKEGLEQGIERGIQVLVETYREFGQTMENAVEKLVQKYALSAEEARKFVERYWNG